MKSIPLPLVILLLATPLAAVSEIYTGSRHRSRHKVHPDLKLYHPKITPEFLSSFKPTELDFEMGWVIVDKSAEKFPEHITADDLRRAKEKAQ